MASSPALPLARRASQLCFWAWVIGWLAASAGLLVPLRVSGPPNADLVIHFSLFFALALWTATFCRGLPALAGLVLLTAAFGVALEVMQGALAHRTFAPGDLAANVLGTAVGGAVAALVILALRLSPAAAQGRTASTAASWRDSPAAPAAEVSRRRSCGSWDRGWRRRRRARAGA